MMLQPKSRLTSLEKSTQMRTRRVVSSRKKQAYTIDNKILTNFAGNDYLGLAQDDRIKQAMIDGINEFGFGSASSPMITGYSSAHQQLEEHFADFSGRERALFFNSGYHANLGVISTFANRNTPIIADKHVHASLIDAITLSRAPHDRYHHHDHQHAEAILRKQTDHHALLITESVFSMTGAITRVDQLSILAKENNATLIVDDAHGIGILGNHGRGATEHFHLNKDDVPLLITPFGKAIAGMGAIVSGNHDDIEYLLQHARTYCYSTAMPPAFCRGTQMALRIIQQEPWRIERLRALIQYFHGQAAERKITLIASDMTPIKCILTGGNELALALQEKLISHGLFVAAIRPPTVPVNAARLRISLSAAHTETNITLLLDILA